MFEEFGFNYVGPIYGHDLDSLVPTLQNMRELRGPQFLHVVTKKGHGYKLAEADPILYHGPGRFDPAEGIRPPATPPRPTYTQVFSDWICDMAALDDRLVAITPAMREGSGLVEFEKRFPRRYFDVGIAEQHAVTFAAGLACEGMKPVVAIYSTFLQRGYDQLVHDVALQNLPVLFALDRAGLVGADGATHAGAYDFAYLRCIPNMAVLAPSDENECRQMLYTAFRRDGPSAVRYPRGAGIGAAVKKDLTEIPFGRGEIRRTGKRVAILAFGSMLAAARRAGPRPRRLRHRRGARGGGGRGQRGGRVAGGPGDRHSPAAAGVAGPLHRPRRAGAAAARRGAGRRRHRACGAGALRRAAGRQRPSAGCGAIRRLAA